MARKRKPAENGPVPPVEKPEHAGNEPAPLVLKPEPAGNESSTPANKPEPGETAPAPLAKKPESAGSEPATPARKPKPDRPGPGKAAKNPFPIVVPKGEKDAPTEGRVSVWFRELLPGGETQPEPGVSPVEEDEEEQDQTDAESRPVHQPVERATSQLLPGRLVPEDPGAIQQEIRFLRTGPGQHVVTLGWNIGDPPEHVTLNHSSIQPIHARMTYLEGAWWIENLSRNDPVMVNDSLLRLDAPPRRLADGDRIRLGVVIFRYRIP